MQIWVLSGSPAMAAGYLDDKRVVKMVLETTQILTSAMSLRGYTGKLPVAPTHRLHPCVVWTAASSANFWWVLTHLEALHHEYTMRVSKKIYKEHEYLKHVPLFCQYYEDCPAEEETPFVNCTAFKDEECVYRAYGKHLIAKWDNDIIEPRFHGTTMAKEIRDKRIEDMMKTVTTNVYHQRP
jgi:hypothetical protein